MSIIRDEKDFGQTLKKIDQRISLLNDQKITAFFESLALSEINDSEEYLKWETILIVVPSRVILNDLKKYKVLISRIEFIVNPNALRIYIFDFKQWKNAAQNKTQFQIRELLKTSFGGTPKTSEDRDWVKLLNKKQPL